MKCHIQAWNCFFVLITGSGSESTALSFGLPWETKYLKKDCVFVFVVVAYLILARNQNLSHFLRYEMAYLNSSRSNINRPDCSMFVIFVAARFCSIKYHFQIWSRLRFTFVYKVRHSWWFLYDLWWQCNVTQDKRIAIEKIK